MSGTTTKLVTGILVVIVGLVLLPVLTTSLETVTRENRFVCTGGTPSGTNDWSVYCTLTGTFTTEPANARTLTLGTPLVYEQGATRQGTQPAAGSTFTVGNRAAAAGTAVWAPSVGANTVSLLQILPLVFAVGLIVFGVYQFVSVARERLAA